MSKRLRVLSLLAPIVLINVVLAFFYSFSSWYFWDRLSRFDLTHSEWSAFQIFINPVFFNKGSIVYMPDCFPMANYPFILFWVMMAVNLAYISWILYKK